MRKISIATLADGAVIERADYQLQRALEDIQDPNTSAETVREVVIKLRLKPSVDRTDAIVSIQTSAKLAAMKPRDVQISLSSAVAAEFAQQESIRFDKS
jgi:hypothetical protein